MRFDAAERLPRQLAQYRAIPPAIALAAMRQVRQRLPHRLHLGNAEARYKNKGEIRFRSMSSKGSDLPEEPNIANTNDLRLYFTR